MEFEWRSRFLNSIQGGGKKPWESNAQMVKMAAAYGSLFILLFPVNRLFDREVGFIIILLLLLLLFPPPVPSNVRSLLVGRIFSVLAVACRLGTEWAGLRLIHHHHLKSFFYCGISPF